MILPPKIVSELSMISVAGGDDDDNEVCVRVFFSFLISLFFSSTILNSSHFVLPSRMASRDRSTQFRYLWEKARRKVSNKKWK